MISKKVTFLEISSFVGLSIGAVHFYGKLRFRDRAVELKKKLTKRSAVKLSKQHDWHYRPGDLQHNFDTKEEIIALAIKTYKYHFPESFVLVEGSPVYVEPHKILDAPDSIKEIGNNLYEEAEKINWWDGDNEDRMDELSDEWSKLLKQIEQSF